jgi:hypothetical protein
MAAGVTVHLVRVKTLRPEIENTGPLPEPGSSEEAI